jgi:hypothetical protein
MSSKAIKSLYMMLSIALLLSMISVMHSANAQTRPSIFVSPATNTFFTDETPVGSNFTVSIKTADWTDPGVFGYQYTVTFDPSMLSAVDAQIPTGHWLTPTIKPGNIFVVDSGTIDNSAGTITFAAALLSPELGKTGGGILSTVTFQILTAPTAGGSLASTIGLTGVILVDPSANPIASSSYDVLAASFAYSTPPPPWYIRVSPPLVAAAAVGDKVTVTVDLVNAKASGQIVGVQFRLLVPSVLTTTTDDVTEGAFLKSFGDTFFQAFVETDTSGQLTVLAFDFLLPSSSTGTYAAFPDGNGTLATITFTVTSLPSTVTLIPLTLTDVIIVAADGSVLPYRRLEAGSLLIPTLAEDVNNDGVVNIQDLVLWAISFGATPGQARYNAKADINRDGVINIVDGVLIAKSFGRTVG